MAKRKIAAIVNGAANSLLPGDILSANDNVISDLPSVDFNSLDPDTLSSAARVSDVKEYIDNQLSGAVKLLKVKRHTVPDPLVQKYILLDFEVADNTDVMVQIIGGGIQIPYSIDPLNANFSLDGLSKNRLYTATETTPSVDNEAHEIQNPIQVGAEVLIVYQTEE